MLGTKMQPFVPPEAGMPFMLALTWAWVDLSLGLMFRIQGVVLEAYRDWYEACCSKREVDDVHIRSGR
jgi:hypothetical protein